MDKKIEKLKTVSVRVPIQLYEKLIQNAEIDTRSLSQQIIHYLKQAVNRNNCPDCGNSISKVKRNFNHNA